MCVVVWQSDSSLPDSHRVIHVGIMLINLQTEPYVILQMSLEKLRYEVLEVLFYFIPIFHMSLNHPPLFFLNVDLQVRFVCSEPRAMISSITELSTCKYALTFQSPMLCKHP